MSKRKDQLKAFLDEVAEESAKAGQAEAFAAYGEHFRLALEVIRLRKSRGWTQQQLAKKSGVQQSEISRIERGQANPTYRTLLALANAAHKTIGFIEA